MNSDKVLSNTINSLRLPLTIGVVFIHFTMKDGFNYHGVVYGLDNPPFFFFIVNLFSEVLARVCVPLFFVISGFLFFFHLNFNWKSYVKKISIRVKTLLLPFVLWNIIAAIFIFGKSALPFYPDVTILFSFNRLLNTFFYNIDGNGIIIGPSFLVPSVASPLDVPLWFVRDLMVMVLFAPVHYMLISSTRGAYIVILGILWFISSLCFSSTNYIGMLIMASFFFSWGAFYSIRKVNPVVSFRRLNFAPIIYVIVAIADALTKNFVFNEYLNKIGIFLGVVSFVIITSYVVEHLKLEYNKNISGVSFFIFSFHTLFMGDLGKVIFRFCNLPGDNSCFMLIIYFTVPLLALIICCFLYMLVYSLSPRICSLLVGNR